MAEYIWLGKHVILPLVVVAYIAAMEEGFGSCWYLWTTCSPSSPIRNYFYLIMTAKFHLLIQEGC